MTVVVELKMNVNASELITIHHNPYCLLSFQLHMIGENTRGAIIEQVLVKFMRKGLCFLISFSDVIKS